MLAVVYERFKGPLELRRVPDPTPPRDGVVVRVKANGICRSDWHGWRYAALVELAWRPS